MPPVLPPSIGAAPTAGGLLHLALDVLASASRQLEAAAQHAGRKPKDDAQALIQADRTLRSTLVHLDELQRLEANNWPTIDEPVAPQEVVESTVAATLGRGNGQIGLEQVIPDEVPLCVRGDGKRLRHALGALVEFAAAGTSGSGLQVGARWRGGPSHGMAVFYVHDPSPGASAALDLGRDGIRVNSVHPGVIQTPMTEGMTFDTGHVPLHRIGQPTEIAQLAVYLASEESSFVTGAEFVVDGGETAGTVVPPGS